MKHLNYQVINKNSNIRWQNRNSFVEQISGKVKNKIAILSIHFNNFENTKRLLDYFKTEDSQNFDIVLIENSTKNEEKEKLAEYIKNFDNVIYIQPISNVGSAGGYALGMEYIFDNNYKYFFLVEDDVIFLEKNIFSDMIKESNKETLTFINSCENTWDKESVRNMVKSWWVQTAGYPVDFVKKIGIIDPRYFFRGEDLEWQLRIEDGISKYNMTICLIDHNYLHPYLKSANGNNAWFYFAIRNQLLSFKKHPLKYYKFFISLFLYLFTGITKIFIQRDFGISKAFFGGVYDFFANKYDFDNNTKKIKQFINNKKEKDLIERVDFESLKKITHNIYGNRNILVLSGVDIKKLSFSKRISDLFAGILISSSSIVFYPLTLLSSKVVCLNELDLDKNIVCISQYKNRNLILNVFWIVISLIISILVSFVFDVLIVLYVIITLCLIRKF